MRQISSLLDRLTHAAAVALVIALLLSVVTGVISRLVGRAVPWSDEAAQYLLVWCGFVGWMIAARRRSHIRITVFTDMLPRAARLAAEIAIQLTMIAFALSLLWWGWPLIERNWDIEWISLPLPSGLLYLPIPFAAAVLVGQAVVEILGALRGRLPHEAEPGAQPL